MIGTPIEDAARAPVRACTGPGLLKYRVRYRRAVSFTPLEYRTRACSRYLRGYPDTRVPQSAGQLGSARSQSAGADLV